MADKGSGEAADSDVPDLNPAQVGSLPSGDVDPLSRADVGLKVIRGGALRVAGYGFGTLLTAVASILLLRYLGVADFGRYTAIASLIAIVGGVTDVGLTAVAGRDLALRAPGEERARLLGNLLGLRLVLAPLGALSAVAFTVVAGFEPALILGAVLAGIGLVLTSCQVTMSMPLSVELRVGQLTVIEVVKQVAMLVGIALLVVAGAGLSAFFAVSILVALAALVVTRPMVGRGLVWRPVFDQAEWRRLIREVLPLAAAAVIGVVYFRVLIVLMSLIATAVATGLFATSFRIVEMLLAISSLLITVALPVLAVAAADRVRLGYMLQRMTEVAVITAGFLVVVVGVAAEPVLVLLGGDEYRDAAPILRVQVFALVPMFVGQVCQVGLVAVRRQSALAVASGVALVVVVAAGLVLIPSYEATGAAIAALIAETALALACLIVLVRGDRSLRPNFRFVWKIGVALGLAAGAAFLPGLPVLAAVVVAALSYSVVLWLTGAIPTEVVDALAVRRSG